MGGIGKRVVEVILALRNYQGEERSPDELLMGDSDESLFDDHVNFDDDVHFIDIPNPASFPWLHGKVLVRHSIMVEMLSPVVFKAEPMNNRV